MLETSPRPSRPNARASLRPDCRRRCVLKHPAMQRALGAVDADAAGAREVAFRETVLAAHDLVAHGGQRVDDLVAEARRDLGERALAVGAWGRDGLLHAQAEVDHVDDHLVHRRDDAPSTRRADGCIGRAVAQQQEGRGRRHHPLAGADRVDAARLRVEPGRRVVQHDAGSGDGHRRAVELSPASRSARPCCGRGRRR